MRSSRKATIERKKILFHTSNDFCGSSNMGEYFKLFMQEFQDQFESLNAKLDRLEKRVLVQKGCSKSRFKSMKAHTTEVSNYKDITLKLEERQSCYNPQEKMLHSESHLLISMISLIRFLVERTFHLKIAIRTASNSKELNMILFNLQIKR